MARVRTLKQRIAEVIRKYKHIDKNRFVYNRKPELKGRFNAIRVWILINDASRGYSIFSFRMQRKLILGVKEWERFFNTPLDGYKHSLYTNITQGILPAINNKSGTEWRFISLLAWTRGDDLHRRKNTAKSHTGHKAAKKRNANARNTNRRRHRNKKR